jgi:hypothetical protein
MDAIWIALIGILGILLQQSYSKNMSLREGLKNKKQKLYQDFIIFLYNVQSNAKKYEADELVKTYQDYYPKILTFASNEVVKCFGDYMQHVFSFNKELADKGDASWNINSGEYFGDLILAIRKDLGHNKWWQYMKWYDSSRLWLSDINIYLPESDKKNRGTHNGPHPIIPKK